MICRAEKGHVIWSEARVLLGLTLAGALQNRICLIYGSEKVYVVWYKEVVLLGLKLTEKEDVR